VTRVRVLFLNGPNANLYGLDPKGTYGRERFEDIAARCHAEAERHGVTLDFRQSQEEAELLGWIHAAQSSQDGIIINGAGLSYRSVALLDALLTFPGPILEVHMSNIHRREPFRHRTLVSQAALGSICGFGPLGYALAIRALAGILRG
jgi:3-dehydroquinate dehydratase-2